MPPSFEAQGVSYGAFSSFYDKCCIICPNYVNWLSLSAADSQAWMKQKIRGCSRPSPVFPRQRACMLRSQLSLTFPKTPPPQLLKKREEEGGKKIKSTVQHLGSVLLLPPLLVPPPPLLLLQLVAHMRGGGAPYPSPSTPAPVCRHVGLWLWRRRGPASR